MMHDVREVFYPRLSGPNSGLKTRCLGWVEIAIFQAVGSSNERATVGPFPGPAGRWFFRLSYPMGR
jgi:hypothetical protein